MSVEHPFEVTLRCRHGIPVSDPDAVNCVHYEYLFEQGTHRVTAPGARPRDSREQPAIPEDTGEDGRTNLHS